MARSKSFETIKTEIQGLFELPYLTKEQQGEILGDLISSLIKEKEDNNSSNKMEKLKKELGLYKKYSGLAAKEYVESELKKEKEKENKEESPE